MPFLFILCLVGLVLFLLSRTLYGNLGPGYVSWVLRRCWWGMKWFLRIVFFLVVFITGWTILGAGYEDWVGARAWAKAKAELTAAGISLDPKDYIPPPVPDAENFTALPIFKQEPDPTRNGMMSSLALDRALEPIEQNQYYPSFQTYKHGNLPYLGKWARGEKTDMAVVQKQLLEFCQHASPPIKVPDNAGPSEILALICPALADFRAASSARPACRFNLDYSGPGISNLSVMTCQMELGKSLAYEEQLAVLDGQPQLALDDLEITWKVSSGFEKTPTMVSGLVDAAILGIHEPVIAEGLDWHVWNDQQLVDLDGELGKIDFLSAAQFWQRGDLVVSEIPLWTLFKADRFSILRDDRSVAKLGGRELSQSEYAQLLLDAWLAPDGRIDMNLASYAPLILPGSGQMIDPGSRRVFPERGTDEGDPEPGTTPDPAGNWYHIVQTLAEAQAHVDEARIACRLERYHLAHGVYPDSLDALAKEYGELPHDIINGESYHYKPKNGGSYVLYSVGWDGKDDGGKVDPEIVHGPDWVWMNRCELKNTGG